MRFPMRHFRVSIATAALALAGLAGAGATAHADPSQFAITGASASITDSQAGAHPDFTNQLDFAYDPSTEEAYGHVEDVSVDLPPGMIGNPQAFPTCPIVLFAQFVSFDSQPCPFDTQVGIATFTIKGFTGALQTLQEPLWNLPATDTSPARLGFIGLLYPVVIDFKVRSDGDYGITGTVRGTNSHFFASGVGTTTWGVPADPSHDQFRVTPIEAYLASAGIGFIPEPHPSSLPPRPFMSNGTSCAASSVHFDATIYELLDQHFTADAPLEALTGCDAVPFDPETTASPTSTAANAPSGLDFTLQFPQEALSELRGNRQSDLRKAVVTLPEGLTINSSTAEGRAGCTPEQIGLVSSDPIRFTAGDPACPAASKVGEVHFETPVLPDGLDGSLYLAKQNDNPFHSLLAGYLVAQGHGVTIKVAGRFDLDPKSGRIKAIFDDTPQLPFSRMDLELYGGPRGPLTTPNCGAHAITAEFEGWSGAHITRTDSFTIDQSCASGRFAPGFRAGSSDPSAGSFTDFVLDVTRNEGEQDIAGIDVTMPPGLVAKLAGVPLCPEVDTSTGSCPAASRIGSVDAAVGSGDQPLWVPQAGKEPTAVFLAGPYQGDPYSIVAKVPAQAGPFDLGVVTVRSGVHVNPTNAQVSVRSDRFPQILQGIPIEYRDVRVNIDRRDFMLNPTGCAPTSVDASISSDQGAVANPSSRFRVGGCGDLPFGPRFSTRLFGGTQRGAHPRLRATLKAGPGEANIRRAVVTLPSSEFLEQAHIKTVCTRVQFAADACPKDSVYGYAKVKTPLLDQPLQGPVYLRSSSHKLPDLVVDLHGQIDVTLSGRIDSVRGGIRTTFEAVPDAPVGSFVLTMKGGEKGLIVNSRNLCARPGRNRADVLFSAHSGARLKVRPVVRAANCDQSSPKRRSHRGG
jgi:hypothetical protein